jgi:hypothetical protein
MSPIKAYPFWRKQYLFHPKATSNITLLKLYHPYRLPAKINWWLWKKISWYQSIFTFNLKKDTKLNYILAKFVGNNADYVWVINRGTDSIHQKITGLFIAINSTIESHDNFFFKWGDSKIAIESIKNEIEIYTELSNYPIVPKILQYQISEKEAFYTTQIVKGTKYPYLEITGEVLGLTDEIAQLNPLKAINYCISDKLLRSFNHGDFCPWNMIIDDKTNEIRIIDWEFCGIYLKGFDLLYFIFCIEFQVKKNSSPETIMEKNYSVINHYYSSMGISDWKPYLKEFAEICADRFANEEEGDDFLKLVNYCNA